MTRRPLLGKESSLAVVSLLCLGPTLRLISAPRVEPQALSVSPYLAPCLLLLLSLSPPFFFFPFPGLLTVTALSPPYIYPLPLATYPVTDHILF